MRRYATIAFMAVALLAGCGKKESGSGTGSTPASKYGSPEDTAKTFFAACAAGDWKALGECCAKSDEGIAEIRDGKLSDKDKETFKTGLGKAKIGTIKMEDDKKSAGVNFSAMDNGKDRPGLLKVVLEGTDWKVTGLK